MPIPCLWTSRVWDEFHIGNLTRAYRDVLLTLRTYRGHGGQITPAHATLADRAGCSSRTVQRALAMGRALGLVSWMERRIRATWRWLRTSNSYRLDVPADAVQPGLRPAWPRRCTNGQNGGEGESPRKQEADKGRKAALVEFTQQAAEMPDLLAMRRQVMRDRLLAGWRG